MIKENSKMLSKAAVILMTAVILILSCASPQDPGKDTENQPEITVPDVTGLSAISANLKWNDPIDGSFSFVEVTANSTGDVFKVVKGIQTVQLKIADRSKETFTVRTVHSSGKRSAGVSVTGYTVGATGPAGGFIFYINQNAAVDGWTYLEAAPSDQNGSSSGIYWGGYGTTTGATGTAVGTGKTNTAKIVSVLTSATTTDCAAKLCSSLTIGGYSGWFLPSMDELNLMYTNLYKADLGGFSHGLYWSSSEYYANDAWYHSFGLGIQNWYSRYYGAFHIRACRQF
jgi:hypothetical protein